MSGKYGRVRGEIKNFSPLITKTVTNRTYKNSPPTSSTTTSVMDLSSLGNGDIMSDIVSPSFKKDQARGIKTFNPMRKEERECKIYPHSGTTYSSVNITVNPPNGSLLSDEYIVSDQLFNRDSPNFPIIDPGAYEYIYANAINSCFATAHQRDVMGLVDMMEMGKTKDMILTNLGRLDSLLRTKSYKSFKLKGFGKAERALIKRRKLNPSIREYKGTTPLGVLADASGLWLEWHYGVMPTVLSIEGLIRAYDSQYRTAATQVFTFRGSDSHKVTYDETKQVNLGTDGFGTRYQVFKVDGYTEAYARAGLISDYAPSLQARLGLEIRDLVPGVYELIPMSFVLDWVFNVGDYLEAVTPVKGFKSQQSWLTTVIEDLRIHTVQNPAHTNTTSNTVRTWSSYDRVISAYSRVKVRTIGVSPKLPSLDFHADSLTHSISGLALALSQAKRFKAIRQLL